MKKSSTPSTRLITIASRKPIHHVDELHDDGHGSDKENTRGGTGNDDGGDDEGSDEDELDFPDDNE
jgi:hypothetical protein